MAGLILVKSQLSSNTTGKVQRYVMSGEANNVAVGDCVLLAGVGTDDGIAIVHRVGAGTAKVTGVVVGFDFDVTTLSGAGSVGFLGGAVARGIYVAIDPFLEFDIDIASGSELESKEIGFNMAITTTAATITGGMMTSNTKLTGTAAITTTLPFRILELFESDGAATPKFSRARVRMNASTQATTAGVSTGTTPTLAATAATATTAATAATAATSTSTTSGSTE